MGRQQMGIKISNIVFEGGQRGAFEVTANNV